MAGDRRHVSINSSAIPVAGLGGIGMLGVAVIIAIAFPEARWIVVSGVFGGAILGAALIVLRRRRKPSEPSGDLPFVLFRERPGEGPVDADTVGEPRPLNTDRQLAVVH